jgi:hypothetical protein
MLAELEQMGASLCFLYANLQLDDKVSRSKIFRLGLTVLPFLLLCSCQPPGLNQFQPDISRGGRAVVTDVNPVDSNVALVGSEAGVMLMASHRWAYPICASSPTPTPQWR